MNAFKRPITVNGIAYRLTGNVKVRPDGYTFVAMAERGGKEYGIYFEPQVKEVVDDKTGRAVYTA